MDFQYLLSRVPRIVGIVILLVWGNAAQSAVVQGLYAAPVGVNSQDASERQRGFQLALEAVLVKLTGDGAVATLPELTTLMSRAQTYVARYSYRTADEEDATAASHILDVHFDPTSLNRALNTIGLPIWGAERPETLIWLAVQEPSRRYMLAKDQDNGVQTVLQQAASKRGLPLQLPLMDAQDKGAIDFADVYGGFTGRVQDASRRYAASTVLTGHARKRSSGWQVEWVLYHKDRLHRWQSQGVRFDDVAAVGMEGLANQLASTFSVSAGTTPAAAINVHVENITSLDDYASVLNYLNGLSVVDAVSVDRVTTNAAYFRVNSRGSDENLRNAIAINEVLQPLTNSGSGGIATEPMLHYILSP